MVPLRSLSILRRAGHNTDIFSRTSKSLSGARGCLSAFLGGFYPLKALNAFRNLLDDSRPDLVHAHDVYPLISPWIFRICRSRKVPAILTCHDYRMTCPVSTHFRNGRICLECLEKGEWFCARHNCRGNLFESLAYAGRNAWARRLGLFEDVDLFLTPSEFTRRWLIESGGLPPEKVTAVGNPVSFPAEPPGYDPARRSYIAYAGRFSSEKGVPVLARSAASAGLELRLAGDPGESPPLEPGPFVRLTGELRGGSYDEFLDGARILAVPSVCFESFGLAAVEAMARGVPVIVSRIGALAELVQDGENGLLVPPGDEKALAAALRRLWSDPGLCRRLSAAGRETARRFSPEAYLDRLIEAYRRVLKKSRQTRPPDPR